MNDLSPPDAPQSLAGLWAGKYRLPDDALALLNPGGLYVIDDMH
jgi:hypothetical protein